MNANATAAVPSSRPKNYRRGGGDRNDRRSLIAARIAAILLAVSIAAAAFFASHVLTPHLRSLLRSSSSASAAAASSPCVLWLFVVAIAAAIWILHHAAEPHDRPLPSDWAAQLWHDDEIHPPPTTSEYYHHYDNDVNVNGESAFEAEAMRKSIRVVVESPKAEAEEEEEEEDDDDESMESMWKAIVRRRGMRKGEERAENGRKHDATDLPRKVVYKEGVVTKKKKAAAAEEGWRKRREAAANDELFRRVETFIKKHYDHLRLQRQESEQRRLLETFRRRARS